MLNSKEQSLLDALEPVAASNGVEIVTVEIVGSKKNPTVRVYIDLEGGVSFDELSAAQVWINEVIDKMDPFPGAFMLEVSSPGIDRPLRTADHFACYVGSTANVKMAQGVDGRTSFTGEIVSANEEAVVLKLEDEQEITLPLANMKKAHLKGVIDFNKQA